MWAASALSMLGDQLARVALTVLVFDQTGSALLAGLALAVTLLPGLFGGPVLAGLADRYPRREVMVWCNLLSVGLVALMAVPGLPLFVLLAIVFAVVLLESPLLAARATLVSEVFPDDRYTLAQVVNNLTFQGSQVLGYAVGGAVVVIVGPRPALLVNAVTFAVAAAIVRLASPRRPAADSSPGGAGKVRWTVRMSSGARLVFGTPHLRQLVLLSWLAVFWVVPEGLAAPWAAALGGTATTVGLLMAAAPVGTVIGAVVVGRLMTPALRERLMLPLAATAGAPMLLCAVSPPLPIILMLLAVAGFGSSYQLAANTTFMQSVPNSSRGQGLGTGHGRVDLRAGSRPVRRRRAGRADAPGNGRRWRGRCRPTCAAGDHGLSGPGSDPCAFLRSADPGQSDRSRTGEGGRRRCSSGLPPVPSSGTLAAGRTGVRAGAGWSRGLAEAVVPGSCGG